MEGDASSVRQSYAEVRRTWALHAPCSSFVESVIRAFTLFAEAMSAAIGIITGFSGVFATARIDACPEIGVPGSGGISPIGGKTVALAWSRSGPIRLGLRHSGCSAGIEIVASGRFEPDAIVRAREPKRFDSRQGRAVHHVRNEFIASRGDGAPCPMKAREVAAECGTPSSGLFSDSRRDGLASLSKRFRKWHARRPMGNLPFPGSQPTCEGICPCGIRGDREGCGGKAEKFVLAKQ